MLAPSEAGHIWTCSCRHAERRIVCFRMRLECIGIRFTCVACTVVCRLVAHIDPGTVPGSPGFPAVQWTAQVRRLVHAQQSQTGLELVWGRV